MVLHPCKQLYSHPLHIQLETDDGRIVINEIPDAIYQKIWIHLFSEIQPLYLAFRIS